MSEQEFLSELAKVMGKHLENWPEGQFKKISTAMALLDKVLHAALNPTKHDYWDAGEPDCPREIKAGNGELHTMRCKVCGVNNPRDSRCMVPTPLQHNVTPRLLSEDHAAPDEDWFEQVISDTIDIDWRPRDAAKAIMRRWDERWYPDATIQGKNNVTDNPGRPVAPHRSGFERPYEALPHQNAP